MSVIFGIVMLNNQPVKQEVMDTMKKALEFWGPDAQGMWREGAAGLGNLLLYNTPEAVFEKMPFGDSSDNFVFTAGARIDNRAELCRIFKIAPMEAFKLPDSYFIMRAYQRWGENCSDHLLGDWAFAVWDKAKQRLFVARDHHGVTAMYYYKGNDFFVFSSSLKGILCLPEVKKKVNEYKVAQILVGWNEGGPETCYQDIFRLPPAHTLSLQDGNLSVNRYWFLEQTPELRLKEEQQYIDLFLDIYAEAVRCRLRSYRPVGATLSGGLDSGSVCALASRELKKEGKRLPAFTSVPLYDTTGLVPPNRIGDEGPLAQAVADFCGNIDITFCKAENIGPLEGVERMLEIQDEPIHAAANAYWIIDIMEKAKEQGIGTLLIGQGGNATVSWPIEKLRKRIISKSVIRYIAKSQICFHLLNSVYEKHHNFSAKNTERKNVIENEYLDDLSLKIKQNYHSLKAKYSNSKLSSTLDTFKYKKNLIHPGISSTYFTWNQLGNCFGIAISDATVDKNLLRYTWSIPPYHNIILNNYRGFATLGFNNLLPKENLESLKRGLQSADIIKRCNSVIQTNNMKTVSTYSEAIKSQRIKMVIMFSNNIII